MPSWLPLAQPPNEADEDETEATGPKLVHRQHSGMVATATKGVDRYEARAGELLCRFELVVADPAPVAKRKRGIFDHQPAHLAPTHLRIPHRFGQASREHKSLLTRATHVAMVTKWLDIMVVGCRDLSSPDLFPLCKPTVTFRMGEKTTMTLPCNKPAATDPNFIERRRTSFMVELPADPVLCPNLEVFVHDHRLNGLATPLVASGTVELSALIPTDAKLRRNPLYRPPGHLTAEETALIGSNPFLAKGNTKALRLDFSRKVAAAKRKAAHEAIQAEAARDAEAQTEGQRRSEVAAGMEEAKGDETRSMSMSGSGSRRGSHAAQRAKKESKADPRHVDKTGGDEEESGSKALLGDDEVPHWMVGRETLTEEMEVEMLHRHNAAHATGQAEAHKADQHKDQHKHKRQRHLDKQGHKSEKRHQHPQHPHQHRPYDIVPLFRGSDFDFGASGHRQVGTLKLVVRVLDESFPAERWGEDPEGTGQEPEFAPIEEANGEGECEGEGEGKGEGEGVDDNMEFLAKMETMNMKVETWWESMPGNKK